MSQPNTYIDADVKDIKLIRANGTKAIVGMVDSQTGKDIFFENIGDPLLTGRTPDFSWRNIANGVGWGKGNQGGGGQGTARCLLYIRDRVKAGYWLKIGIPTCSDHQEGASTPNDLNLNGTKMQMAIESVFAAGANAVLDKAYPAQNSAIGADAINTNVVTKVFDTFKGVFDFWYQTPVDIAEDSYLMGWIYGQGRFPVVSGTAIRELALYFGLTTSTPASDYIGPLFRWTANTNGQMALFDDAGNGLTGMSNATRNALTNTSTDGSYTGGDLWMIIPVYVEAYSNRTSIVSHTDSTGQSGGSSFSRDLVDGTCGFGLGGALFAAAHPVMELGAFGDGEQYYINNPTWNAVRRSLWSRGTHFFAGSSRNLIPAYVGDVPGMVAIHEAYMNLPELKGLTLLGYTQPPYSTSTTVNYETTPITDTQEARLVYNRNVRSDSRFSKVYDAEAVFRNPINQNQLKPARQLRTVVGSIDTGTNLLNVPGGGLSHLDTGLRVGNSTIGATGVPGLRKIAKVVDETKAILETNAGNTVVSGNFVVGSCLWTSGLQDKIHYSDDFQKVLRLTIGERGKDTRFMGQYQVNTNVML